MRVTISVLTLIILGVIGFFIWIASSDINPVRTPVSHAISHQGHIQ